MESLKFPINSKVRYNYYYYKWFEYKLDFARISLILDIVFRILFSNAKKGYWLRYFLVF